MGRQPSLGRSVWESFLRTVMPNDWPSRLAVRCGVSTQVLTTRHDIGIRKELGAAKELTIAFASDWHAGATTPEETLDNAMQAIAAAKPDVLLLGGDFVVYRVRDAARLARKLERTQLPLGVFAVFGNHDHYIGVDAVRAELESAGVRTLLNESHRFSAPFDNVTLCGIDDHLEGAPDATRAFAGASDVRVLLMHEPSGLLDVRPHQFDLAFCGHTHGGQIALPGSIPIWAGHGPLSRRYAAGRYDLGDATMITSRGVGCSVLPIRWNAPAEIVVCILRGT